MMLLQLVENTLVSLLGELILIELRQLGKLSLIELHHLFEKTHSFFCGRHPVSSVLVPLDAYCGDFTRVVFKTVDAIEGHFCTNTPQLCDFVVLGYTFIIVNFIVFVFRGLQIRICNCVGVIDELRRLFGVRVCGVKILLGMSDNVDVVVGDACGHGESTG